MAEIKAQLIFTSQDQSAFHFLHLPDLKPSNSWIKGSNRGSSILKFEHNGVLFSHTINEIIDISVSTEALLANIGDTILSQAHFIKQNNMRPELSIVIFRKNSEESLVLYVSNETIRFCEKIGADIDIDIM